MDKKKVFCYGDSNTYGYDPLTGRRHPEEVRWTGRLQALLGDQYQVVEQGCNGRTTVYPEPGAEWKSGLYALKVSINTYKPVEIMIIMLGSNDLKTCYKASAKDIAKGAEKLVTEAKSFIKEKSGFEPKIILVSPIEAGEGIDKGPFGKSFDETAPARSREFPELYREVAKRTGCYFVNAALYANASEADHLHMMPDAHEALAEVFYKAVMDVEGLYAKAK